MPVILVFGRFRFKVYPKDHGPPHVHVESAEARAKFEIGTANCLAAYGFSRRTLNRLSKVIRENQDLIMEAWNEYQDEDA